MASHVLPPRPYHCPWVHDVKTKETGRKNRGWPLVSTAVLAAVSVVTGKQREETKRATGKEKGKNNRKKNRGKGDKKGVPSL